jgi:hypothetical protein
VAALHDHDAVRSRGILLLLAIVVVVSVGAYAAFAAFHDGPSKRTSIAVVPKTTSVAGVAARMAQVGYPCDRLNDYGAGGPHNQGQCFLHYGPLQRCSNDASDSCLERRQAIVPIVIRDDALPPGQRYNYVAFTAGYVPVAGDEWTMWVPPDMAKGVALALGGKRIPSQ